MTQKSLCNEIQETMACERHVSELHRKHIAGCTQCTAVQQQMMELDSWVDSSLSDQVPDGFAQKVMRNIDLQKPQAQSQDLSLIHRLLEQPAKARYLQGALLVVAVTLGLGQVIRFLVGIFITTLAAAF